MAHLEFALGDLQREIQWVSDFGKRFLEADSLSRLQQLKADLGALHTSGEEGRWENPKPIVTRPTNQYAKGHGAEVWGEVSSTWDLKRIGKTAVLELTGIASTRVSIMRTHEGKAERIAFWRMEIGDEKAPGCYFHSHVEGDNDDLPFPGWLEIPRLPGLLPTPPCAVEFVLAELFQAEWEQHVSQALPALQGWAALQRRRMDGIFRWQLETLETASQSVPWSALKRSKPTTALVEAIRG